MRLAYTISRHVLREVCSYAAIGQLAILGLLVAQNFARQLDDLIALGAKPADLALALGTIVAFLSAYALPIALLFGVLVAFGQLAADREIDALRALGVPTRTLAAPVLALALALAPLMSVLLREAEPAARRALVERTAQIARRGDLLQAGVLTPLDRSGERLALFDRRDADGGLHGVFVADRSRPEHPFVIAAASGALRFEPGAALLHLLLEDGDLLLESGDAESDVTQRIHFRRLDYALSADLVKALSRSRQPRELSDAELRAALRGFDRDGAPPPGARERRRAAYEIQLARRAVLPATPLVFAALGVALGVRSSRSARSRGALVCVAVAFAHHVLLSTGEALALRGALPAGLAIASPTLALGALAVVSLARADRGRVRSRPA